MKATLNGVTLAESDETVFLEGNHYFPPDAVKGEHLVKTRLHTLCPWKGIASYYTVQMDGQSAHNAAWSYRRPWPWIRRIREYVAFSSAVEVRR